MWELTWKKLTLRKFKEIYVNFKSIFMYLCIYKKYQKNFKKFKSLMLTLRLKKQLLTGFL